MPDSRPSSNRSRRFDVRIKVSLKYADRETFVERFSQNLSRSGIFIRASDPAPVGSRVHFEYRLADDSRILRGVGVVRWQRKAPEAAEPDNPPGMGIEFVDLDPQTEELIQQIVATRGEGSRAPQSRPRKAHSTPALSTADPASHSRSEARLDPEEELALDSLLGDAPLTKVGDGADSGLAFGVADPALVGPNEEGVPDGEIDIGLDDSPPMPEKQEALATEDGVALEERLDVELDAPALSDSPAFSDEPALSDAPAFEDEPAVACEPALGVAEPQPKAMPAMDADAAFDEQIEIELPSPPLSGEPAPVDVAEPEPPELAAADDNSATEQRFELEMDSPPLSSEPAHVEAADGRPLTETDDTAAVGPQIDLDLESPALVSSPDASDLEQRDEVPIGDAATAGEPITETETALPRADEATGVGTEPLVIDLCGVDLTATKLGADGGESHVLSPRLCSADGVSVDETGSWLPGLISLVGRSFPSPYVSAFARRFGLPLVRSPDGGVAVTIDDVVVPVRDALMACLGGLLAPLADLSLPAVVILPTGAKDAARAYLEEALPMLGLDNAKLCSDAQALFESCASETAPDAHLLTVDVGLLEARIALVQGGTVRATLSSLEAGLTAADGLLADHAAVLLLREHGLDIEDNQSLKSALLAQIAELRRQPGASEWKLSLAGSSLVIDAATVEAWSLPLHERVTLACETLLAAHDLGPDVLASVVLAGDEPAWPGLGAAIEKALGCSLVLAPGAALRLQGAVRCAGRGQ